MKQYFTLLPAVALLSACGQADGELSPGNWKSTMTMTKFDIPGAPIAMAQNAKAMLGKGQSIDSCITPEMAKAGVKEMSSSMQQGDCKMEGFKQGSGKMSGTMKCTNSAMGATSMKMDGSYTAEKVNMTLSGEIADAKLPGGKADIEMTMNSERTGDCKK
ncbi:DUF3617 domain-containing protein [Sphingorhabdus pulchriflava]|uniref:DUF3617 domain-containing protein n=1 Tax=Sphingorhabdus pulchriflava TaxID=2292257 RepID=A0A371BI42_9SPHN|nr:DUF3617 family protein [Sphingorhabdus pulchriflava]RDV07265.1 DUF3617 domain-containing protein [Sphingorhabdus pulchriflava]